MWCLFLLPRYAAHTDVEGHNPQDMLYSQLRLHFFMRLAGPQGVHGTQVGKRARFRVRVTHSPAPMYCNSANPQVPTLRREQPAEADGARGCIRGLVVNISSSAFLYGLAHITHLELTRRHPMHPDWHSIAPRPALSRCCDGSQVSISQFSSPRCVLRIVV